MKMKHTFKGSAIPIFPSLTFNMRTIQLRLKVNGFYKRMLCKGIIHEKIKRNKNMSKSRSISCYFFPVKKKWR